MLSLTLTLVTVLAGGGDEQLRLHRGGRLGHAQLPQQAGELAGVLRKPLCQQGT